VRHRRFEDPAVAKVFASYPAALRKRLMALRELIFDTGAELKGVGRIEEALRWGEPAYLTTESGSGSSIRLGCRKSRPSQYAMYFNCQTKLVDTFRTIFPRDFKYEGNRAILFEGDEAVPAEELALCIEAALTYHRKRGYRS
jgi:Domain of unknown function (DU1801)